MTSNDTGNIFTDIPSELPEEFVERLDGERRGVRIERIISRQHSSAAGFWYDQSENEWVVLLKGSAGILLEGNPDVVRLGPGDWLRIPARVRHRVEWTDDSVDTVWLAVFYPAGTQREKTESVRR